MADARTTIRFDSVGAEKVKKDYADIIAADQKTGDSLKKTGGVAAGASSNIINLGKSTQAYAAHATVATTASNALGAGLAALGRYASAGALLEMGRRTLLAADSYRTLQARVAGATAATGDFEAVSRALFAVSQATGSSLESNVSMFQRLATGAREFGATSDDIIKVTEVVQKLGVIGGTSAASISAGTMQFAQAMAAGVVRAEEWNSIVENMPELANAIASGFGLTVGQMRQAVLEGRVLSEEVFKGLQQQAGDVADRFEDMPTTIEQAVTKIQNAFSQAAGESHELVKGIDALTDGLTWIATNMDGILAPFNERLATTRKELQMIAQIFDWFQGEITKDMPRLAEALGMIQEYTGAGGNAPRGAFGKMYGQSDAEADAPKLAPPGGGKGRDSAAAAARKAANEMERAYKDLERQTELNQQREIDYYLAIDEANKKRAEAEAEVRSYIDAIAIENDLMRLSAEEREVQIALIEAEMAARKANRQLTEQERADIRAGMDERRKIVAAKEAADEVEQIWLRARDNVSDAWSDFLFDIFDKGKISFKSFANDLKSIWARTIADMIAQSTQQSIVEPLFKAMFGGAAGSVGVFSALKSNSDKMGSLADLGDGSGLSVDNGSGLTGLSGFFKKNLTDPLKGVLGTKVGASSIGGVLGGAGLGYGIGQIAGSGQGGAIGGAIGAMVGGPIGSLIGGIFGGLIGGLFKSTPRSIASISTTGGLAGVGATYAQGLDEKIGKSMGGGVTNALNAIAEELDATLTEDYFLGMIGQRGKKFFFQEQQSDIKKAGKSKYGAVKFESAEEAIAAAIEAAIKNGVIQGLSTAEEELLRAADDVNQALQDIVNGRNFRREVELSFIGLTNPMAADLARLSDQYAEQKKLAEKYGADMVKLEAIYQANRKEIIEQYQEQQFSSLKALLTSLTSGSASPLSPTTRLGLAESRYNSLRAAAMRGDDAAIEQLAGAATDFLDAAKAVYATSDGYFSRYNAVIDDVSKITGVANPLTAGVQAVNDNYKAQIAQGERAIAQRAETNSLLRVIASNLGASTSATQRAAAATTANNGVAQIGGFTPEAIQKLVAGIRS